MKLGEMELIALSDGRFRLDGGAMFGIVPKPIWNKMMPADENNRIELGMNPLLIRTEGKTILINSGIGTKDDDKFKRIYGIDSQDGQLVENLAKHGIQPEDITDVIIGHLHFDHNGGLTRQEGDHIIPTFPKATIHISKLHLDTARNPCEREQGSFRPDDFEPALAACPTKIYDQAWELIPGKISITFAHGHTPGQQVVTLHDGGKTVIFCGDVIPTKAHLPVPYVMAYDINPVASVDERRALAQQAVDGALLYFEHEPGPPLWTVHFNGKHFVPGDKVSMD